jgi:hypothetical protein
MRLCAAVALLLFALPVPAQYELITIEKPFRAHNLAGIVVDPTGAPVAGVVVEDRDAAFKRVLFSITTDASGHFAFAGPKSGKVHYLHLQSNGFDPLQITVKLRRATRGELRIQLHVAS